MIGRILILTVNNFMSLFNIGLSGIENGTVPTQRSSNCQPPLSVVEVKSLVVLILLTELGTSFGQTRHLTVILNVVVHTIHFGFQGFFVAFPRSGILVSGCSIQIVERLVQVISGTIFAAVVLWPCVYSFVHVVAFLSNVWLRPKRFFCCCIYLAAGERTISLLAAVAMVVVVVPFEQSTQGRLSFRGANHFMVSGVGRCVGLASTKSHDMIQIVGFHRLRRHQIVRLIGNRGTKEEAARIDIYNLVKEWSRMLDT